MNVGDAESSITQTVEGIKTINAAYQIGQKYNLDLPIIENAYKIITNELSPKEALDILLNRSLKKEIIL